MPAVETPATFTSLASDDAALTANDTQVDLETKSTLAI